MFDRDLDIIMRDQAATDEVTAVGGALDGKTMRGIWVQNHLARTLGGNEIGTKGPIFTTSESIAAGLTDKDALKFLNTTYTITRVMPDGIGMVRVELDEILDGDVVHGEL